MNQLLRTASFAIAVTLGLAGSTMAQDASTQTSQETTTQPEHRHGRGMKGNPEARLNRLSRELNLTDDQKSKLKPLFESEWQEMKPVRDDASLSKDQKREKMKGIHQKYREQISSVLTTEQLEKWKKMQKDRRHHGKTQAEPQS